MAAGRLCDGPCGALRYAPRVNTENALKLLFELRAVLNRITDDPLGNELERATRLTDACISQLTSESNDPVSEEEEDD
jgi:hypothetical protein